MRTVNTKKVLCSLFLIFICFSLNATVCFSEARKENKRFMKEYAQFTDNILNREPEIRLKMREMILANGELVENKRFGQKDLEIYKIVYGDFSWKESDNAVLSTFVEKELNSKERNSFSEISEALTSWGLYVYLEEIAKVKVGEEKFKELNSKGSNYDKPEDISRYIQYLIKPYLTNELSDEDLKGKSFKEIWPK